MNATLEKQFNDSKNRTKAGNSIYQDNETNYEVSQGPHNLTGRTPITMNNSTLTEIKNGGTSMG